MRHHYFKLQQNLMKTVEVGIQRLEIQSLNKFVKIWILRKFGKASLVIVLSLRKIQKELNWRSRNLKENLTADKDNR